MRRCANSPRSNQGVALGIASTYGRPRDSPCARHHRRRSRGSSRTSIEQVLLRIARHAVEPAAALATGARSLPSGRRARPGLAASADDRRGDVFVNRLGLFGVRRRSARDPARDTRRTPVRARGSSCSFARRSRAEARPYRSAIGDVAIGALHRQLHAADRLRLRGHVDGVIQVQRAQSSLQGRGTELRMRAASEGGDISALWRQWRARQICAWQGVQLASATADSRTLPRCSTWHPRSAPVCRRGRYR